MIFCSHFIHREFKHFKGKRYFMDFSVFEPYSPYDYELQIPPHPAFSFREELTRDEIRALTAFQDLGVPQNIWDITPPDAKHANCSVINAYLRDASFRKELSRNDMLQCGKLISLLDSAIEKSVVTHPLNVIRGLSDSAWFEDTYQVGMLYKEEGFGSYSLSIDSAVRYAGVNPSGKQVFLARVLDSGSRAVYLGEKENEMLVKRDSEYIIDEVVEVDIGELSHTHKANVYILREVY